MPPGQQRLASYFDEPLSGEPASDWYEAVSAPAAGLSDWVDHAGKTVFVPHGKKPEDKPADKHFYEKNKEHRPFDDSYWGHNAAKFSKNEKSRAKREEWEPVIAENKRVIADAKASGVKPAPNSTKHVPFQHWRPSDEGFDHAKLQQGNETHAKKVARIAELKKLIGETQAEALRILKKHSKEFKGERLDGVMGTLMGVIESLDEYKKRKAALLSEESLKISKDDTSLVKKRKRQERTMEIHMATTEILEPEKNLQVLKTIKAFAEHVGDHYFAGTSLPSKLNNQKYKDKYVIHDTLWHAYLSTMKHQILQSITKKFLGGTGNPKRFADKSHEASLLVAELQKLTHRKNKRKSRPPKDTDGNPITYPDHAQLVKWSNDHKPK